MTGVLRFAAFLLGSLLGCAVGVAQQVSPAIMEYPNVAAASKVDGHFELANDSLSPLFVTIEAKSFTIGTDGNAVFTPLKSDLHLELSATSVHLGPHQHRTVYYRVSGSITPAWFCIYSNFSGLPRKNGMTLQLELPHTVYLYGKNKAKANDLVFADVKQTDGHVSGRLSNHGDSIVRVLSMDLSGEHVKKTEGGFPLLPGGERDFDIALSESKPVRGLRARTAGFHVETIVP